MPGWMWIVIAAIGGPGAVLIIWKIYRSNFSARIAGQEFSITGIPGSTPAGCSEEQAEVLLRLERRLTEIYTGLKDCILKYMVEIGVPKNSLSNNGDYEYILSLIWQIVYGKNGKHSVRTIVEDYILTQHYKFKGDFTRQEFVEKRMGVMREITPHIDGEARRIIEEKYDNIFTHFDLATKETIQMERAVTSEKVCELISTYTKEKLSPIIEILLFDDITGDGKE